MPLVGIYFLSLDNNLAREIGLYILIGKLFEFLFQIPSNYLADTYGHKNALIISKILLFFSSISFIISETWIGFSIASALLSVGFSFMSSSREVFIHETAIALEKEKNYQKYNSLISSKTFFFSAFLALGIPYLTSISILMPFYSMMIMDFLGIIIALSLKNPQENIKRKKLKLKEIKISLYNLRGSGFYSFIFINSLGISYLLAASPFVFIIIENLGFLSYYLGILAFFWMIVQAIVAYYVHKIENIDPMKILYFEVFMLIFFILLMSTYNLFVMIFAIILMQGFFWGKRNFISGIILKKFVKNNNLKATVLAIKTKFTMLLTIIFAFFFGYLFEFLDNFYLGTFGFVLFLLGIFGILLKLNN